MRNITPMNTPMIEKALLSFCARMVCRARRMASKKGIYSYRSASTGSSRAAFLAGRIPNKRPVKAAKPRARTTEPMGTYDGTGVALARTDRKSTRLNSSHSQISYAVFCLKKKKKNTTVYKKKRQQHNNNTADVIDSMPQCSSRHYHQ